MMIINTTESLFNRAREDVENVAHAIGHLIEGEAGKVATTVKQDASRIVHSITVGSLAIGKDITLRLDHANGEVKRIVVNGELTVEVLIAHIRSLSGVPEEVVPEPVAPVAESVPVVEEHTTEGQ